MELRQLKYFLAVADARSFASAANTLFVSRQAVSKAISQLETEMGVALFIRDSGGAVLTPAGVMFYDSIRSSITELDQAHSHMLRYGKRYQQHIRIAFSPGILPLYEDTLLTFLREQKNLSVEYREYPSSQCLEQLADRKADMVLITHNPQSPELETTPLRTCPYGVLLQDTPNLRSTHSLTFEDLSWLPLAGISDGNTQGLCKTHRLSIRYTGLDTYRLFSLTLAGQCAMLLPECLIPNNIPGLRWFPLENVAPWTLYCITLRSAEHNILNRTALDTLQSRVFEVPPELG